MIEKLMQLIEKEGLDEASFFCFYRKQKGLDVVVTGPILGEYESKKFIKVTDWRNRLFELRQSTIDSLEKVEKSLGDYSNEIKQVKADNKKKQTDAKSSGKEIAEWIEEYRELFKGTKPGAKGDKGACLNKMVRFFETYPEFADKDLIFQAAKDYIDSEAQSNYKYLQRADYFIFKRESTKGEEMSRLASFCDEVDDNKIEGFTKML